MLPRLDYLIPQTTKAPAPGGTASPSNPRPRSYRVGLFHGSVAWERGWERVEEVGTRIAINAVFRGVQHQDGGRRGARVTESSLVFRHLPALPMSRKNHTLPVRLSNSGIAYRGLRSRSTAAKKAPYAFDLSQLFRTAALSRDGWVPGLCARAARRMNGVVRPQAKPTSRKPVT